MDWIKGISTLFGFNKNFNMLGIEIIGGSGFNKFSQQKILELVLGNPAMVKVIALQCDMFSLGKFYYYENEKEKKMPPEIAELLKKPNYQENMRQLLWDWMFWNMLGVSWVYIRDKNFTPKMYVLNSFEIDLPEEIDRQGLIFAKKTYEDLNKKEVAYTQDNGKVIKIPYGDLLQFTDLTSSPIRSIQPVTRLQSLYKVILNTEESLKALNINTRFAGKFIVTGKTDVMDTTKRMLSTPEKDDIEGKIEGGDKSVHAVKSMVDIRRFVENMKQMELSKAYLDGYFIIGNMYNIPRDVLEAYNSSTYENQEKARASHVSYCLDPKGAEFGEGLAGFFGLPGQIVMSWDHLPFVQVMEKEREETKSKKLTNLKTMLDMGIEQKEALGYVDLKFKPFEYAKTGSESPANPGTQGENGESTAETEGGDTEEIGQS